MNRPGRIVLRLAIIALFGATAWGFVLLGSKWNTRNVTMQLQLGSAGALVDGSPSWNAVAEGALATWNQSLANLQFTVVRDSIALIGDGNGINNVFFDSVLYGSNFGNAVAVTTEWTQNNGRTRIEADVVFNSNLNWNSYRGNIKQTAGGQTLYDLRRVALHEFGHVLGLDHPDEHGQFVDAIMNSRVSNVDALQPDDISGGQSLYGAAAAPMVGASFTRPISTRVRTSASSYLFRGRADPARTAAVYLTNSRIGIKRYLKASGVAQWKLKMPLQPGRNTIRLYVRERGGPRTKLAQRVVLRQGS